MLCGDLNGKEIQKRGDICVHIADSLCSTVETNNITEQLHSNKIFLKMQCFLNLKSMVKCKEKDTNSYILYNSISMISEKGQMIGLEIISDC